MNILLCNDDGYRAPGLERLFHALKQLDDVQVEVIAPEHNNSAKSNSLTLHAPLYVREVEPHRRYVTGTPADCIHIALTGLLDYRPDLLVSGINNGANMGDDTLYSGTIGAATEGYLFGIDAIAFSQVERGWAELDAAVTAAVDIVQRLRGEIRGAHSPWLHSVNIPNLPLDRLKPLRVCRLGRRHCAGQVFRQENPLGETMYWIGLAGSAADAGEGTDFHAVDHGHIALTPLGVDLTDHRALDVWRDWSDRA